MQASHRVPMIALDTHGKFEVVCWQVDPFRVIEVVDLLYLREVRLSLGGKESDYLDGPVGNTKTDDGKGEKETHS